jgi:hypothetical protein
MNCAAVGHGSSEDPSGSLNLPGVLLPGLFVESFKKCGFALALVHTFRKTSSTSLVELRADIPVAQRQEFARVTSPTHL